MVPFTVLIKNKRENLSDAARESGVHCSEDRFME